MPIGVQVIVQGRFPRCVGTHLVALFDPKTGKVHHLHHALIFEGQRPTEESLEAIARRNAEHPRFHVKHHGLQALHLRDAAVPHGPHRVDLKNYKLVPA